MRLIAKHNKKVRKVGLEPNFIKQLGLDIQPWVLEVAISLYFDSLLLVLVFTHAYGVNIVGGRAPF